MSNRWRFLNTGAHDGAFNMAFDEQLATDLRNNLIPPTLRVYHWKPFTISIGYHQEVSDFHSTKIERAGIGIVRRPTGGRAIFHAHELTYSVVMKADEMTPREIYHYVNEGLLEGVRSLGIDAELVSSQPDFKTLYNHINHTGSLPCFAVSAKSEIQHQGRKLVGSAQRRFGDVILQHGSLLLGPEHRELTNFLAPHVADNKTILDAELISHTTDAESILHRDVTFDEAADHIRYGFKQKHHIEFEADTKIIASEIV